MYRSTLRAAFVLLVVGVLCGGCDLFDSDGGGGSGGDEGDDGQAMVDSRPARTV